MDTPLYRTDISVRLSSIGSPHVVVTLDDQPVFDDILHQEKTITIDRHLSADAHVLGIEHRNKSPQDPSTEVQILSIGFNGIESPKFVWQGIYEPIYPEPWATQQQQLGTILKTHLENVQNLGWNGKWTLTFSVPIFTWIHHVEDLGWIHPVKSMT